MSFRERAKKHLETVLLDIMDDFSPFSSQHCIASLNPLRTLFPCSTPMLHEDGCFMDILPSPAGDTTKSFVVRSKIPKFGDYDNVLWSLEDSLHMFTSSCLLNRELGKKLTEIKNGESFILPYFKDTTLKSCSDSVVCGESYGEITREALAAFIRIVENSGIAEGFLELQNTPSAEDSFAWTDAIRMPQAVLVASTKRVNEYLKERKEGGLCVASSIYLDHLLEDKAFVIPVIPGLPFFGETKYGGISIEVYEFPSLGFMDVEVSVHGKLQINTPVISTLYFVPEESEQPNTTQNLKDALWEAQRNSKH